MENVSQIIGKKIKQRRKEKGMTQEYLAEQIGIAPNYLGQIENGHRGVNTTNLIKISNALNITFDYLLSDLLFESKNENQLLVKWQELFFMHTPEEQKLLINIVTNLSQYLFKKE